MAPSRSYAYATLLASESFSDGLEVLIFSLSLQRPKFPLLLLHTPAVQSATVSRIVRRAHMLPFPVEVIPKLVPTIDKPVDEYSNSESKPLDILLAENAAVKWDEKRVGVQALNVENTLRKEETAWFKFGPKGSTPSIQAAGENIVWPSSHPADISTGKHNAPHSMLLTNKDCNEVVEVSSQGIGTALDSTTEARPVLTIQDSETLQGVRTLGVSQDAKDTVLFYPNKISNDLKQVRSCPVPSVPSIFYSKLHIWNQVEYEKVLYIDVDCLILEFIEHLFNREIINFPALAPDVLPPDRFNAGVILLRPSLAVYEDMMRLIGTLSSYDHGDTGFLNAYYPNWFSSSTPEERLTFSYNAQRIVFHWSTNSGKDYWKAVQPVKILHFSSSPKPWELNGAKGELELLWMKYFISYCSCVGESVEEHSSARSENLDTVDILKNAVSYSTKKLNREIYCVPVIE